MAKTFEMLVVNGTRGSAVDGDIVVIREPGQRWGSEERSSKFRIVRISVPDRETVAALTERFATPEATVAPIRERTIVRQERGRLDGTDLLSRTTSERLAAAPVVIPGRG